VPDFAPLLDLREVTVSLGRGKRRTTVLHEIDLAVGAGEVVGLIGETGSGKTTIARTIVGAVTPDSGEVHVTGVDVAGLGARALREFRRSGSVQYVFQDPLLSLDPDRTVGDSVAEGLQVRGGLQPGEIQLAVAEVLQSVALPSELAGRLPAELSGGQRQRVAVARALVVSPRLLLCDEPVSALDAANRIQVLDLLLTLRDERGLGIVFISHDLGSVAGVADRIVVLYRGRVVEEGPTDRVVLEPRHPYTRLLLGSAPSLAAGAADRSIRQELRRQLDQTH
jgi:ABC-type glutathione transport system ATPase component